MRLIRTFIKTTLAASLLVAIPAASSPAFAQRGATSRVQRPARDARGLAKKYAIADTMAILGADVGAIRKSKIWGKAKKIVEKDRAFRKLAELDKATGFEPLRDMHALVMIAPNAVVQDDDKIGFAAIADVDEQRLVSFLQKKSPGKMVKKTGAHGEYYEIDGGKAAMAFRGSRKRKEIIIAEKSVFDAMMAGSKAPAFIDLGMRKVGRHDIFAVGKIPAKLKRKLARDAKELADLEHAALGAKVRFGFKFDAFGNFSNTSSPKSLVNMAKKGQKELLKEKKIKKLGLTGVVRKARFRALGPAASANISLTSAEVSKLFDTFLRMM